MGESEKPNALENTVFYLGLIIILSLVGYLIFQMVNNHNAPADIRVHTERSSGDNCTWEVIVQNEGETTAENVNMILEVYHDGEAIDRVTPTVDYLPLKSRRTLHVLFHSLPGSCDSLVFVSVTHEEP